MAALALTLGSAVLWSLLVMGEGKCGGMLQFTHLEDHGHVFEEYAKRMSIPAAEVPVRKQLFAKAMASIKAQNAKPDKLWVAGLTEQALMTDGEKQALYGYMKTTSPKMASPRLKARSVGTKATEAPDEFDWRKSYPSVVTPVKNQGHCGSCWAFASSAVLESAVAIATGKLFELSPQQLTSCTPNPQECGGSGGCNGATSQLAFDYAAKAGISSLWTWPYTSGTTQADGICFTNAVNYKPVAGITGYHQLPTNEDKALLEAVLTNPVSVSVAASDWHLYKQGIFDGCNPAQPVIINHAVVLSGYGSVCHESVGIVQYWLVRNSWGPSFGEDGYIRIRRFPYGEPCSKDDKPLDGTACKANDNASNPITVCGMCGILYDSAYPTGASLGKPAEIGDPAYNGGGGSSKKVVAAHVQVTGLPEGADGAAFMQQPMRSKMEL